MGNFSSGGSLKQHALTAFSFWCWTALSPSTQARDDRKVHGDIVKTLADISFPRVLTTVQSPQKYCKGSVYSILGIFPFTSSLSFFCQYRIGTVICSSQCMKCERFVVNDART